jgi:succinate dehydrogenase flavin-adding protein (antitoxin of CptAB toxin-antitoxin module)
MEKGRETRFMMTSKREDSYRKQLLYRSRQRGWLEVDIILGSWASDHLPKLDKNTLLKYEKILNQDTTDIFVRSKSIPQDLDKDLIVYKIRGNDGAIYDLTSMIKLFEKDDDGRYKNIRDVYQNHEVVPNYPVMSNGIRLESYGIILET